VRARSLNFRALRILEGLYPVPATRGVAALSDGAGEVLAVGSAVTRVSIGDRIVAAYFPRWVDGRFSLSMAGEQFGCTRDGMLAPLVAIPEAAAVRIPDNLSFEEAGDAMYEARVYWDTRGLAARMAAAMATPTVT